VAEYKQTLQLSGKSAYENLYQVVRRLMQTIIETPNPVEGIDMFQILAPSRLLPSKGEFELRFNEQMRPLLLNLRAHFAKIPLPIFFRIQGSYAVRFYLFCKSWDPVLNRSPGWRMTVEELRAWLGLQPGEYEQTFHIRAAIIERAKDELDEVADVSFVYDAIMDGKRIVGVRAEAWREAAQIVFSGTGPDHFTLTPISKRIAARLRDRNNSRSARLISISATRGPRMKRKSPDHTTSFHFKRRKCFVTLENDQ
jgi:hypothetical protein